MAACSIDLILNAEVSGTTSTNIGSAKIFTGSNTNISFRSMMGTSTTATASLEVKRFTGATLITSLEASGTGLQDISGTAISFAGSPATTGSWATGKVGTYSLEFEASDTNRVSVPVGATTGGGDGETGTIAAWIYRDAAGSYPMILSTSKGSVTNDYSYFAIWTGGAYPNKLVWQIYQGGAEISSCYSALAISDTPGEWIHVAVSCDGTNTKFYINATQSATTVGGGSDGKWYADGDANTTVAHIGNLDHGSGVPGYSYPFPGKLDEVAVWTEALNIGGVEALYNDGVGARSNTVSSSYLVSYYDMEVRGPGSCQVLDRTDNNYDGTLEDMDCGVSIFEEDWYDFYASGSAADVSTLVKGIKVTLY